MATSGGAEADIPDRRCIVTGEVMPAENLVRFVIGPEGDVVPDVTAKLPGRGYWVAARRDVIEKAVAQKVFMKAWARQARGETPEAGGQKTRKPGLDRQPVAVDPGLATQVEGLLLKQCLGLLGLARRAGLVVTGFDAVRDALAKCEAVVLVQASDAAADGAEKLARLARGMMEIKIFSRDELSLALGRENVVHAALKVGGLTDRFRMEAGRLAGLRPQAAPHSPMAARTESDVKAKKV